jgi:hypothetical protein
MIKRYNIIIILLFLSTIIILLIGTIVGAATKINYDSEKAIEYAKQWCKDGNNCPDGQFQQPDGTDCTHFISHVLKAGGADPSGPDQKCSSNLIIRVNDLDFWFKSASELFGNVETIKDWKSAQPGDFVFQRKAIYDPNYYLRPGDKSHVMMLAGTPTSTGAIVYGHQKNRCANEFVEFDVTDCNYYRIQDTTRNGKWISSDIDKRFTLEIDGLKCTFTERRSSGQTLTRQLQAIKIDNNRLKIERINDEAVLIFLEFSDPALRAAILSKKPDPSFLIITKKNDGNLQFQWNGLLVRKNPNNTLKEVVQPSQVTPKFYDASKQSL